MQYFNTTYQHTGTLWEGRYKAATLIDSEACLLTCYSYIELNPVRANMVSHPGEYRWSSYHANALVRHDSLVQPHNQYLSLDNHEKNRQAIYRELFRAHIDEKSLEEIRQATQKGRVLGSNRFKDNIERLLQRRGNLPVNSCRLYSGSKQFHIVPGNQSVACHQC